MNSIDFLLIIIGLICNFLCYSFKITLMFPTYDRDIVQSIYCLSFVIELLAWKIETIKNCDYAVSIKQIIFTYRSERNGLSIITKVRLSLIWVCTTLIHYNLQVIVNSSKSCIVVIFISTNITITKCYRCQGQRILDPWRRKE